MTDDGSDGHRPATRRSRSAARSSAHARARRSPPPAGELPQVVLALVDASADPVSVGRVVALVVDAMTTRLLTLGIERFGEPPTPWAWLALGSAARQEQALATDQDHALAYDAPEGRSRRSTRPWPSSRSSSAAGLEEAGIPRCKGDAMATNPAMRRSVEGWTEALDAWRRDLGASGSILSSIVYDFRRVTGPLDPEPELEAAIREAAPRPGVPAAPRTSRARPSAADGVPPRSRRRAQGRARRHAWT